MSKEQLTKIKVSANFKCNPTMEIINYQDEVENNKAVKVFNSNRIEKNLVELDDVFCSMNMFSSEPFCTAEVITLKNNLSEDKFIEVSNNIYKSVFDMMNEMKKYFSDNVNNLSMPDKNYLIQKYNNKINEEFWKEIPCDKFVQTIMDEVESLWNKKLDEFSFDKKKYEYYLKLHLYEDAVKQYLSQIKTFKFINNNICFQDKQKYEENVKTISNAIIDNIMTEFFSYLEKNK